MKNLIYYFIVISIIPSFVFAQHKKDTIYLIQYKNKTYNKSIFIEPYFNSKKYQELFDIKTLEKEPSKNKFNIKGLPTNWIELHNYNKTKYIYYPCDIGNNQIIKLLNDKIYYKDFEIVSFRITSFKKLKKYFEINYKNFHKIKFRLEIFLIDKKSGIYVFKYFKNGKFDKYKLMIDFNKCKHFPLIINNCKNEKSSELKFNSFDFEKIIRTN